MHPAARAPLSALLVLSAGMGGAMLGYALHELLAPVLMVLAASVATITLVPGEKAPRTTNRKPYNPPRDGR